MNLPQAIDNTQKYCHLSNLLSFCFTKGDVENNFRDIETKKKRWPIKKFADDSVSQWNCEENACSRFKERENASQRGTELAFFSTLIGLECGTRFLSQ